MKFLKRIIYFGLTLFSVNTLFFGHIEARAGTALDPDWKKITVWLTKTPEGALGTCPDDPTNPMKMCSKLRDANGQETGCNFQLDLSRFNTEGIAQRTFTCPTGKIYSDMNFALGSIPDSAIITNPMADFMDPNGPLYQLIASYEPACGTGKFAGVTRVLTRAKCEVDAVDGQVTAMKASAGSVFILVEDEGADPVCTR